MRLKKAIILMILLTTTLFAKEKIVFWYSMGGEIQVNLNRIVDDYNKSQNKIEVVAIHQGDYEETMKKFKSVMGTNDAPAIIQTNDISTAFMHESEAIVPMENFIKEDNFNLYRLDGTLLNYYKINGKLYSMPFNPSTAILLYNKDAFKKAGLDSDKPPKSYKEFAEVAKKLTEKDSNGSVKRYGAAVIMYSWFMEQFFANDKVLYINENNGREGKNPTEVLYKDELPKILNWLREMYKNESATSYGRSWEKTREAFLAGKVAMYFDSSAGIKDIVDKANFQVGAGVLPNESGVFNGTIIGGGSLWITSLSSKRTQKAAWNFIKYLTSRDVQGDLSVNTGYFPVNKEAYDTEQMKKNIEKYPQLKVATEEIQKATHSYETQGAILKVLPEIRERMSEAMEANFQGKDDVGTIVEETIEDSNVIIQKNNRVNCLLQSNFQINCKKIK